MQPVMAYRTRPRLASVETCTATDDARSLLELSPSALGRAGAYKICRLALLCF